jgi:hypothetical protein
MFAASLRLGLLSVLVVLSACGSTLPPAMTPATGAPLTPDATQGSVVLVRPRSGCDTSDHTVVADEHGRFVANVAPGTHVAMTLAPGSYVFYAWSSRDVRFDKEPNFNPVSATRVQAAAGQTKVVALHVLTREGATSNRCYPYAPVALRHVAPAAAEGELAGTQRLVADLAAGQAELDKDPARLKELMAFGERRMQRNEDARENPTRGDRGVAPANP